MDRLKQDFSVSPPRRTATERHNCHQNCDERKVFLVNQ